MLSADEKRRLISAKLQVLMDVYGRRVGDLESFVDIYYEGLKNFPGLAIVNAFDRAAHDLERFPTPRMLRTLANEARPSTADRYSFREQADKDPETGNPITVWIDPATGEKLYRAADCAEGRAALAKLREVCGRIDEPFRSANSRAKLQRQKVQVLGGPPGHYSRPPKGL